MKKLVIFLVFGFLAEGVSFAQDKNSNMTDIIARNDRQITETLDSQIQSLSENRSLTTEKTFTVRTVVIESLQGPFTQVFTDSRQEPKEAAFIKPEEAGQPVAETQNPIQATRK